MTTPLREVDLTDSGVRRAIAEMLPSAAQSKCSNGGVVPAELVEEVAGGSSVGNVADLVLELAVFLTDGHFADEIEIDTSAVELVPAPLDPKVSGSQEWARLTLDLSRPDWTVVVSHQALQETSEPEPDTEGVLRILVRAGLDLRGWLAEQGTQTMLHEWYVQYQVAGTLHSERQLTELHEELSRVEERGGLSLPPARSAG